MSVYLWKMSPFQSQLMKSWASSVIAGKGPGAETWPVEISHTSTFLFPLINACKNGERTGVSNAPDLSKQGERSRSTVRNPERASLTGNVDVCCVSGCEWSWGLMLTEDIYPHSVNHGHSPFCQVVGGTCICQLRLIGHSNPALTVYWRGIVGFGKQSTDVTEFTFQTYFSRDCLVTESFHEINKLPKEKTPAPSSK